jgi:Uma2 family endonuclease
MPSNQSAPGLCPTCGKRGRHKHSAGEVQRSTSHPNGPVPMLRPGDRLTQAEFHRRYETYPDDVKFELVGGIVYMTSPLRRRHGKFSFQLSTVLGSYEEATPGVEGLDNATAILGEQSEPQPDLALRILPEWGGQSRTTPDDYVTGAPEWLSEIAYSTKDIDLKEKKADYRKAGVVEYLVVCVKQKELYWFNFKTGRQLTADAEGIIRSRVFPGLWIHGPGLLAHNLTRLLEVIRQGVEGPEHAAFVRRLQARRKRSSG